MRRPVHVLLLCTCLAGLAACGGASGLTRAQYAAKLNHLCRAQADAVGGMHLTIAMADWQRDGAKIMNVGAHFNKAVSALKPPASLTGVARAYLGELQKVLADDRAAVAAAKARDANKFDSALRKASGDLERASSFAGPGLRASHC
jgi:hypothetical protein